MPSTRCAYTLPKLLRSRARWGIAGCIPPPPDVRAKPMIELDDMDIDPARRAESSEQNLHAYMQQRAAAAAEASCSDDGDDAETAAALAEAAAARATRRVKEAGDQRAAAALVHQAEEAVEHGALMEALQLYTQAIACLPHDVELLAARGSLCARIDRAHAALHDGELIVKLMPDWYKGHALCGLALFCMKQYGHAALAYRHALSHAEGSPAAAGISQALQDAQAKLGAVLRQAAIAGDVEGLAAQLKNGGADPELRDDAHGFTAQVTHSGSTLSTVARPRAVQRPNAPGVGLAPLPSPAGAHVARLGACMSPVGLTPSGQWRTVKDSAPTVCAQARRPSPTTRPSVRCAPSPPCTCGGATPRARRRWPRPSPRPSVWPTAARGGAWATAARGAAAWRRRRCVSSRRRESACARPTSCAR